MQGEQESAKETENQKKAANLLYQRAGVDSEKAEELVSWLQDASAESTPHRPKNPFGETVAGIGGFAALYRPHFATLQDPLLVSASDGVGTKLLLALKHEHLEGLGIDLVAMCANDLFTLGAQPLFFLDYFASGQLSSSQFKILLTGIKQGLDLCQAELLGGETAEMPGLYAKDHFDIAGFMVGVIDRPQLLGRHRVQAGDVLVGHAAQGFHSNGFSLIRQWLQDSPTQSQESALIAQLLQPTKIYHELLPLAAMLGDDLHALAHITGGGIPGNLARVIPDELACHLSWDHLATPRWMDDFITSHQASRVTTAEVFNLGVGMIACLEREQASVYLAAARKLGLSSNLLGEVRERQPHENKVNFHS